ncbi:MAG: site-2 protease family protein [Burkholderiales bacterium]
MDPRLLADLAIAALPIIFAITLHEAAHGYVAKHFGDKTAYALGRVSLNPLRHIDPVGTIAVPLLIFLSSKLLGGGGIIFGWAKPVPVNFHALRKPKQHMLWVAAAGPAANLLMALAWASVLKLADMSGAGDGSFFTGMAEVGIQVNLVLMVLNLLPILPLDGGRIAFSLLPHRLASSYARLEPLGFPILLVLLFTNVLGVILYPMVTASAQLISALFQL